MLRRTALATLLALGLASRSAPLTAQQINTGTPPVGTEGGQVLRLTPFFAGNVAQTFVPPAGTFELMQFQFWARNDASSFELLGFRGYIFEWNDATLTTGAAPLWSSPLVNGTASAAPEEFVFNLSGLPLTPGRRYAAVLSPLGAPFPPAGATYQGVLLAALGNTPGTPIDTYAEGSGYLLQTVRGAPLSATSTTRWAQVPDYAFTATFTEAAGPPSVVPEPGSVALLASGLVMLGVGAVRARRSPT